MRPGREGNPVSVAVQHCSTEGLTWVGILTSDGNKEHVAVANVQEGCAINVFNGRLLPCLLGGNDLHAEGIGCLKGHVISAVRRGRRKEGNEVREWWRGRRDRMKKKESRQGIGYNWRTAVALQAVAPAPVQPGNDDFTP